MQPKAYYTKRLEKLQNQLQKNKRQLRLLGLLRLLVFLAGAVLFYLAYTTWPEVWYGVVGLFVVFAILLFRYKKYKRQKEKLQLLIGIQERELRLLVKFDKTQDHGSVYADPMHAYSADMDMFGHGSFYQYIHRTATTNGASLLASMLKENDINHISSRQQAIKELAQEVDWRQEYEALALMVPKDLHLNKMLSWMQQHRSFLPKNLKYATYGVSLISLALFAGFGMELVAGKILLLWFFCGGAILLPYLKRIQHLGHQLSRMQELFRAYGNLLDKIESKNFDAVLLKNKKELLTTESKQASVYIKQLSRLLDRFDQRNNMLIGVPANGFFLRDIWVALDVELWLEKHQNKVGDWFAVLAWFDAMHSMANFAFNHPQFVYPELVDIGRISATGLGHPLLETATCVRNDFVIEDSQFFIVTGANMAGKSTFLRAVGLAIVMANCGLPVCATQMQYHPMKLISSMRTEDSLTNNASYFFAELSRLKYIVEAIQSNKYFIILDEILKGTNSVDKAIGSAKFVEKLTRSKNTGIIATHDLSLCELEGQFPQIKNYYFDAEIKEEELYFDYQLKQGVCENMNASFLLQKMGIV